jgi:hypothetical protein
MPDLSGLKLGRLPHNPAQVARMPRLTLHPMLSGTTIPTYPPVLDRGRFQFQPGMDDNDQIGDCTAAGYANGARAAAALSGYGIEITVPQAVDFYSQCSGYNPKTPLVDGENPTDTGAVLADVLTVQAKGGFAATNQMLVADFATVEPADLNAIRAITARTGMLYCGVDLALADQAPAAFWDINTPAAAGDPAPGSWGGHCLGLWDWTGTRDTDLVRLATWGTFQTATWRWVKSRLVEAHAVMWRDLGSAIPGLDYDRLKADLASFLTGPIA